MSLRDLIPPGELWRHRQALEDDFADQARAILRQLGVPDSGPYPKSRSKTNDLSSLPGYDRSDGEAARRAEVAAVASRLAERLKDKDDRDASIGGGS